MKLSRALLFLILASLPAFGQTNDPARTKRLSLEDCIELALKHNLDLQIDRYNPEISLYALRADYAPYDPILSLSGEHDHTETGVRLLSGGFTIAGSKSDADSFTGGLNGLLPWGMTYSLGSGPIRNTTGTSGTPVNDVNQPLFLTTNSIFVLSNSTSVTTIRTNFAQVPGFSPFENSVASPTLSVTQPVLKNFWIDQTRLNIRIAKNRLKYTEQTLRLQVMQTITTLEQAYYDLIYDRENVIVQQKAVELAEKLVAENRKRLEVGALAPLDLQSAEAQAASSRAAVIAAKSQLGTQERLLKQLITDQFASWEDSEVEPTEGLAAYKPIVNLQDSWRRGLSDRPELVQAKLDVEKAGIQLKYNRNQLFPELDVFGTVGYNGSGREFSDALFDVQQRNQLSYSMGGSLTFPLANIGARNNYKSAKVSLQQVVLTLKKLEQGVMVDIDNDIGTIRANYDQVQATRTARQYQESALDAEQKKLENGKSTTYTVLQVQRDLTVARGNEIQALDNYNKSLSQLSLHEGSTLDRLHIKLEWK